MNKVNRERGGKDHLSCLAFGLILELYRIVVKGLRLSLSILFSLIYSTVTVKEYLLLLALPPSKGNRASGSVVHSFFL